MLRFGYFFWKKNVAVSVDLEILDIFLFQIGTKKKPVNLNEKSSQFEETWKKMLEKSYYRLVLMKI